MTPKGFLLLAADQADEVILLDRAAHRHSGLRFGRLGLLSAEGTQSSGGDNFAMVDETQADGDTTYVASATATDLDFYTMGNLPIRSESSHLSSVHNACSSP